MSNQLATLLVSRQIAADAGAAPGSALAAALVRAAHAMWRSLEAIGQARAQRALQRLAVQYAHQPELARMLRDAATQRSQP